MATVDASIPLSFQMPQLVNPAQLLSLRDAQTQSQMHRLQLQEELRQQKVRGALTSIWSDPNNIDPSTGQLKPEALARVSGIDPATGMQMRAQMSSMALQQARTQYLGEQSQDRALKIKEQQRQYATDAVAAEVDAYDRAIAVGASPQTASQRAIEVRKGKIDEAERSGFFQPERIQQMRQESGFDIDKSRSSLTTLKSFQEQEKEKAKASQEAPKTRKIKRGTQEIDQEWDTQKRTWKDVGSGPAFKPDDAGKNWSDQEKDLLASLASYNVNLPVGMRSKDQIHATLQGLLSRNEGKTPDEIAQGIQSGKIELGAKMAEARTAGTGLGRIEWATNEIDTTAPLLLEASSKVPRGSFMPINKLLRLYREGGVQDSDQRELAVYVNSMLNAYDLLAARGGTDVKKREDAHSLLTTADSPAALERGVQAFRKEAQASRTAAERTIQTVSGKGAKAEAAAGEPPKISSDEEYAKLPSGTVFIDPDGKRRRKP